MKCSYRIFIVLLVVEDYAGGLLLFLCDMEVFAGVITGGRNPARPYVSQMIAFG